jgi:hypothetical protein
MCRRSGCIALRKVHGAGVTCVVAGLDDHAGGFAAAGLATSMCFTEETRRIAQDPRRALQILDLTGLSPA